MAGSRILLADDNEDAAALLADSLRALGHEVLVAHDGPTALAAVDSYRPDFALLDLGLPVMDGFEVANRPRAEAGLRDLTLIAVTGYAQEGDRRRTTASGFDLTWRNRSTSINSTRSSGLGHRSQRPS